MRFSLSFSLCPACASDRKKQDVCEHCGKSKHPLKFSISHEFKEFSEITKLEPIVTKVKEAVAN